MRLAEVTHLLPDAALPTAASGSPGFYG